jgi:hypothetical protein
LPVNRSATASSFGASASHGALGREEVEDDRHASREDLLLELGG